jgi:hypothetical protein
VWSVLLPVNQWVDPSGKATARPQSKGAIGVDDWTRIYAYIWYRKVAHGETTFWDQFESDPALAVNNILLKGDLTLLKPLSIPYTYGKTPIITVGNPPANLSDTLEHIRDDPGAKGNRYYTYYCCI